MARQLTSIIKDDTKDFYTKANKLFGYTSAQVDEETDKLKSEMIGLVAQTFAHVQTLDYMQAKHAMKFTQLEMRLRDAADRTADRIDLVWNSRRNSFDLLARSFSSFVARKATPPWKKVKLDLSSPLKRSGKRSFKDGYVHSYLNQLVDQCLQQVRQAALNEETFAQLIARLRLAMKLSNRDLKSREATGYYTQTSDAKDAFVQATSYDDANVDVTTGVYTDADYAGFMKDLQASNQWSYRARAATKAEGKQNDYLRKLEQILQYDAASQLHDGLLQIGSDEMGIADFAWVTSGPNVCDQCGDRDGLTLEEIADTLDDDYGDDPPPVHPNCNCQLVPQIKTDWAKTDVEAAGMSWDNNTGTVYNADTNETSAGFSDMTLDDYMQQIGA